MNTKEQVKFINEVRKQKGWSQERLAREANYSLATVFKCLKHGNPQPIGRLIEALGIKLTK